MSKSNPFSEKSKVLTTINKKGLIQHAKNFSNQYCISKGADFNLNDFETKAKEIARHGLDALIDLGGWMDPVALSALSVKPAKKLYKWVLMP